MMKKRKNRTCCRWISILLSMIMVLSSFTIVHAESETETSPYDWYVDEEPFMSASEGTGFDSISIKDPSVVQYDGKYHMFYTAVGYWEDAATTEFSIGYASAASLDELGTAPRYELTNLAIASGEQYYYCSPNVFYYEPDGLWYIIYQAPTASSNNRSCYYSTNEDISDIDGWSEPQFLLENTSRSIVNYRVISDNSQVYLYYSVNYSQIMYQTTTFDDFPNGWSKEQTVSLGTGSEISRVYKNQADGKYYMLYEVKDSTGRNFGLASADTLDTTAWTVEDAAWAAGGNMTPTNWTDMASNGEILRLGYDSEYEIEDISKCEFIVQGVKLGAEGYNMSTNALIPWSLGYMKNYNGMVETEKEVSLLEGETLSVVPDCYDEENKRISNPSLVYECEDEAIASVDETGLITAKKLGTTKVRVTRTDTGDSLHYLVTVTDGRYPSAYDWYVWDEPIFSPRGEIGYESIAVKDVTFVEYEGMYHMFYTASGYMEDGVTQEYTIGYAAADEFDEFDTAERYKLTNLACEWEGANQDYYCAPQVFYYEPDGLWYIIYQAYVSSTVWRDCVYSTNDDISDVDGWSEPQILLKHAGNEKRIDYWVISDEEQVYIFYEEGIESDARVTYQTTSLEDFPNNWSSEKKAFKATGGGYEAGHIYKNKADGKYYLYIEAQNSTTGRSFVLMCSDTLDSTQWTTVDNLWASGGNMTPTNWTDMPSHGEILRSGYDSKCEIEDINRCEFLIQGVKFGADGYGMFYSKIPWHVGYMRNYNCMYESDRDVELIERESVTVAPECFDENNMLILDPPLEWSSEDEQIAQVDENGCITAVGAGEAKVTAVRTDTGDKITYNVNVTQYQDYYISEQDYAASYGMISGTADIMNNVKENRIFKAEVALLNADKTEVLAEETSYISLAYKETGEISATLEFDQANADGCTMEYKLYAKENADGWKQIGETISVPINAEIELAVENLDNWIFYDTCEVYESDGTLVMLADGIKCQKAEYKNVVAKDFELSADIKMLDTKGTAAQILFRGHDYGSGIDNFHTYLLGVYGNTNKLRLDYCNGVGDYTIIKQADVTMNKGGVNNIKLRVEGNSIKVWVNGNLAMDVTSTHYLESGCFGVQSHIANVAYSNFKLTYLSGEEENEPVPVTGIELDAEELELYEGKSGLLRAKILPEEASDQTVIWKSGNENVAVVEDGVVTAVDYGMTTITAATADGVYLDSAKVTVKSFEVEAAQAAAEAAQKALEEAEAAKAAAETAQAEAEKARKDAETALADAKTAAKEAQTAKADAETAKAAAETAEEAAKDAQEKAEAAKTAAETAAASAAEDRSAAEAAKAAAEAAQTEAEDAKAEAEDAQKKAEDAQKAAADAQEKSEAAKTAAETAQKAAADAESAAKDAQENAAQSAKAATDAANAAEQFYIEAAEAAANAAESASKAAQSASAAAAESSKAAESASKAAGESAKAAQSATTAASEAAKAAQESQKATEQAGAAAGYAAQAAEAQAKAQSAQEKAEAAQKKAEDAQKAAEEAQKKAEEAQKKADEAAGSSAEDKLAAQKALEEAKAAQTAAEAAKADAEIAKEEAKAAKAEAAGLLASAELETAKQAALLKLTLYADKIDTDVMSPVQEEAYDKVMEDAIAAIGEAVSKEELDAIVDAVKADVEDLLNASSANRFVDVVSEDWFYDIVDYVAFNNMMTGMDETHFGPYENLSRAQFALILYRMEGEPEVETDKAFADISGDEWYGQAVLWAAEAGIVNGYEDGSFGPVDNITREQMAIMMYRYADYLEKDTANEGDFSTFLDAETVSEFAEEGMKWAIAKQIITGKEEGTMIDPQGETARCEAAAIIQRFMTAYAE